ncbi:NAD(P)H-binding protein [Streptomyces sp. NPDC050982]|uniref:NAD(P)H-binding protein n=1 Tax=Streptomyces sp. NPDC050982 TaxID=3154746 RepID=UPI0033E34835
MRTDAVLPRAGVRAGEVDPGGQRLGDATSAEDLKRALAGSQAVVSAVGPGRARRSDLASRTARALVPAAEATGVRRVVVLSAFGVGDTLRDYKAVPRIAIRLLLSDVFGDKAVADDLAVLTG